MLDGWWSVFHQSTEYFITGKLNKPIIAIIEDIFTTLIAKKYGEENEDKFSVIVNMDRGEIEIFQEKIVK